jgi:hypothetical protein
MCAALYVDCQIMYVVRHNSQSKADTLIEGIISCMDGCMTCKLKNYKSLSRLWQIHLSFYQSNKNYLGIYIKQYRSDQVCHDYTTSLNEMVNNCKESYEEQIQFTDLDILYTLHQINTLLLIYPFQTLS